MTERVNRLYKPAELVAAQNALLEAAPTIDRHEANRILISLHGLGFRVVYVGEPGT